MTNQPAIQRDIIDSLLEIGGEDPSFFFELVELYLTQFQEKLDQIKIHLQAKDQKKIAGLLHQMKSSSGNVGAMALYERCIAWEEQAQGGSFTEANLKELESLFAPVSSELKNICDELRKKS